MLVVTFRLFNFTSHINMIIYCHAWRKSMAWGGLFGLFGLFGWHARGDLFPTCFALFSFLKTQWFTCKHIENICPSCNIWSKYHSTLNYCPLLCDYSIRKAPLKSQEMHFLDASLLEWILRRNLHIFRKGRVGVAVVGYYFSLSTYRFVGCRPICLCSKVDSAICFAFWMYDPSPIS